MEPAKHVIEKCGGLEATASACERAVSSIRKWMVTKEKRGTGGLIPADCQVILMRASAANGWGLKAEDFFPSDVVGVQAEEV
ncbi:hypothetical protein SAMN05444339_10247 [Loktanella atrilutea]|uniref:Uncharacterized protein n=1 Tax=Loktanella atrilutea TaxID=366533 RepID=A0A1M4WAN5_LOKAT|nr:hypothetical protein [Loktanella atrilutea]SHE78220.1 hypothetical protein SAMN05444339_10247 [Loktanella atrilutea]